MKPILHHLSRRALALFDRAIGAEQPKLFYNPEGEFQRIFQHLPQLHQQYRPTPWLSNTHAHLLYFDLIKKRSIHQKYDRIEPISMQDGGTTAIAWLGENLTPETPTIVIMHTITGTPESMRELVRDLHAYTGWRIALCLRRGHAGLPMPVPKINLFGSTDDLREQLALIQQRYPDSDLYAVGSSAGTGLLVRYLGEEAQNAPFKAAFALCPGYNTELGFQNVHPFYSKMMTKKLFEKFVTPYRDTWSNTASVEHVLQAKTLLEFEQAYFEMAGFADYASYNQSTNPIYVFENVAVPLLVLNSEDDPVCHIDNFQPYQDVVRRMNTVAVVTTKKGSHCGFYEGIKETHSWASRLAADFFLFEASKN